MKKLILASTALALAACNGDGDATGGGGDLPVADAPVETVAAPEGQQWSEIVTKTDAGGYLMGNPDAAVQLVEYGSMTCGACARFDMESKDAIKDYVDSGRMSFEFRNYVRDPVDITAALLARCVSEDRFFAVNSALFASQNQWFGEQIPAIEQARLATQSAPPSDQFKAIAEASGLKTALAQRGLPSAQADACLADEAAATRVVAMKTTADSDYPITGTPAFLINGVMPTEPMGWATLEQKLKAALGEPVEASDAAQ
ncbi:DsbA family protein [Sphingomicrobium astaxanthinifaciens]|uniref:DsbA family protein n=1 Tax=Sphingomicrobium astaxanthinifaciens TaxID=1227949 RepID=UPI001FCB9588|nr:thioredoxin domain-containing protein [Sphingomicrobium astaxanthinifaciens]MCJ7421515.1 DsbA family protein [Sphingomicrobium astaxanthinifaciens]